MLLRSRPSVPARRIICAKEHLDAQTLQRAIRCAIERQHERIALIGEKENYHGIFDHLVEGIFRTTPDGNYLLANIALARIYGYNSPVELMASVTDIGRELYVKPERREEIVRLMQQNDTLTGFESEIYRKDGDMIWISENCRAVRDAQGKLLYYEGTVEDITHRLRTEMSLRNSESLYHSLVETMPQNVFRKDLARTVHFRQSAILQSLSLPAGGHSSAKRISIFSRRNWPKNTSAMTNASWKPARLTKSPRNIILRHRKKFCPGCQDAALRVDGKIIGLQGIFWDITEKSAPKNTSAAPVPNCRAAAKNCARKISLMEENLRMAREIQLAMMLQQYPAFPRTFRRSKARFNSRTVIIRRKPSAAIFSASRRFPKRRPACLFAT